MSEKQFDVIITIVNRGYSDLVMDSAREKGATGGTILHGRGTGAIEKDSFFNIKLHEEKEIVMIVVEHTTRNAIMDAIMHNAGINTEAHGIVFSLPVDDFLVLRKENN